MKHYFFSLPVLFLLAPASMAASIINGKTHIDPRSDNDATIIFFNHAQKPADNAEYLQWVQGSYFTHVVCYDRQAERRYSGTEKKDGTLSFKLSEMMLPSDNRGKRLICIAQNDQTQSVTVAKFRATVVKTTSGHDFRVKYVSRPAATLNKICSKPGSIFINRFDCLYEGYNRGSMYFDVVSSPEKRAGKNDGIASAYSAQLKLYLTRTDEPVNMN